METVGQRSQRIVVGLIIKLLVLRCRSEGDANPVAEVPRPAAFLLGEDSCTFSKANDRRPADDEPAVSLSAMTAAVPLFSEQNSRCPCSSTTQSPVIAGSAVASPQR